MSVTTIATTIATIATIAGTPISQTIIDSTFQVPVSAGIVCFAVEPTTQSIYVLLGKDQPWPDRPDGTWADFGGRPSGPDEAPEDTAAREFVEETLGVVEVEAAEMPVARRIADNLRHRIYFSLVKIIYRADHHVRTYYVKEIPWNAGVVEKFAAVRTGITTGGLAYRNHPAHEDPECHLEKTELRWWGLQRLQSVLRNRGKWRDENFRRSFLPALRVLVRKLADGYRQLPQSKQTTCPR